MIVPKFAKALDYAFGLALQMKESYEIRYRDIAICRVAVSQRCFSLCSHQNNAIFFFFISPFIPVCVTTAHKI